MNTAKVQLSRNGIALIALSKCILLGVFVEKVWMNLTATDLLQHCTTTQKFKREIWKVEGKTKRVLHIGFSAINGNSAPHFVMTSDEFYLERGKWSDSSFGCRYLQFYEMHFPEFAFMQKWHLSTAIEPMHYIANSMYWLKLWFGISEFRDKPTEQQLEHFKSTAVLGVCKEDANLLAYILQAKIDAYSDKESEGLLSVCNKVQIALKARLPELRQAFISDVCKLNAMFAERETK